jgi:nitrogen regulatory protein PII
MEEYSTNVSISTVVADSMVDTVIQSILNIGEIEGKIFVYEVQDAIDMKSKRHGESAL